MEEDVINSNGGDDSPDPPFPPPMMGMMAFVMTLADLMGVVTLTLLLLLLLLWRWRRPTEDDGGVGRRQMSGRCR